MLKKKPLFYSAYIFISVITIIVFRFILTGAIPLLDKTEARYSEIARLMYETKEWVVLQIDYGTPFWAKPPLSTWLSASSFEIFGVNEISARLPSFLLCIIILVILGNSQLPNNDRMMGFIEYYDQRDSENKWNILSNARKMLNFDFEFHNSDFHPFFVSKNVKFVY